MEDYSCDSTYFFPICDYGKRHRVSNSAVQYYLYTICFIYSFKCSHGLLKLLWKEIFKTLFRPVASRGPGGHVPPPHFLADQLTLSQPGKCTLPPPNITCPPGFSDLATALLLISRSIRSTMHKTPLKFAPVVELAKLKFTYTGIPRFTLLMWGHKK